MQLLGQLAGDAPILMGGGSEDEDGLGADGDGAAAPSSAAAKLAARRARMRSCDHLARFEFLGQLLGKALFEGILVEPRFAPFVLLRMLGRAPGVEDLPSLDRQVAASLNALLDAARRVRAARAADTAVPDEVEAMGLSMTVADGALEVDLVPCGRDVAVSADNAERYAALFAHHRLNTQIARQVRAFLRGFREIIPLSWLHMFAPHELQLLLGGEDLLNVRAVVNDLRVNTVLQGGYDASDPYVWAFWGVLEEFSPEELRKFLAFVTSVPRPPLLGFASLSPKLGIKPMGDSTALPVAATCFNMLYLRACPESAASPSYGPLFHHPFSPPRPRAAPNPAAKYATVAELRKKLLMAISETEGFGRT
jgi:ubiquitin-protein ligase E3 C